jgi:hypothetical protein
VDIEIFELERFAEFGSFVNDSVDLERVWRLDHSKNPDQAPLWVPEL